MGIFCILGSVELMRKVGYRDVRSRIFPGMRHEILNETGRHAVWSYILSLFD